MQNLIQASSFFAFVILSTSVGFFVIWVVFAREPSGLLDSWREAVFLKSGSFRLEIMLQAGNGGCGRESDKCKSCVVCGVCCVCAEVNPQFDAPLVEAFHPEELSFAKRLQKVCQCPTHALDRSVTLCWKGLRDLHVCVCVHACVYVCVCVFLGAQTTAGD